MKRDIEGGSTGTGRQRVEPIAITLKCNVVESPTAMKNELNFFVLIGARVLSRSGGPAPPSACPPILRTRSSYAVLPLNPADCA